MMFVHVANEFDIHHDIVLISLSHAQSLPMIVSTYMNCKHD